MRALRKRRAATTLRAPTRCSGPGGCSDCAWASATAAARLALGGAAGAALQRLRQPGWGCSEGAWGCSDCGSEAGASTCQRRRLVASSPRRYPSPPRSSPVSSPVVAAPSSRRVIPPRLYPQRQPVRAPCKSSLCGRRVVAAARKTIFWKCHYMSSPVMSSIPSPQFCTPRHSRHWWQPGSLEVAIASESTAGLLAASAAEVAGLGPPQHLGMHGIRPDSRPLAITPQKSPASSEEDGSEDRNEDRSGELPGWFFGRQGEDRSEDRSEDRRRIRVRIGVRVERGSE